MPPDAHHSLKPLHEVLNRLGREAHPRLDASTYCLRALQALGSCFNADGALWLTTQEGERLRLCADFGVVIPAERLSGPQGDPLLESVLFERRVVQLAAAPSTEDLAVVGLPLRSDGRVVGGIFLARRALDFRVDEVECLELAALVLATQFESQGALRLSASYRAEFEAVQAAMADGVIVLDAWGNVSRFNEAISRLSGLEPAELWGSHWQGLFQARTHATMNALETLGRVHEHLLEKRPVVVTACPAWLTRKGADPVPVVLGIATIESEARVVGAVVNVRDATADLAVERLKDEFISTVSHELKTPLTSISGFVELMRHHVLARDEQNRFFDVILSECQRLGRMIADLLDLGKIQSGSINLHVERLGMRRTLQQALAPLQMRHGDTHPIALQVTPTNGVIEADRDRLMQIVINLASNAIQYSPAGGPVQVTATKAAGAWHLRVQDAGIGIAVESLPRLFDRFFRVNDRGGSGTGLGLFITRKLVERHGGTITAESQLGVGSVFHVRLPVASPVTRS